MNKSNENKVEVLRVALSIIRNNGWAKCDGALDKNGDEIEFYDPGAVQFSLHGAIEVAEHSVFGNWTAYSGAYEYVLLYMKREWNQCGSYTFNNHPQVNVDDVILLLENCIQELEFTL